MLSVQAGTLYIHRKCMFLFACLLLFFFRAAIIWNDKLHKKLTSRSSSLTSPSYTYLSAQIIFFPFVFDTFIVKVEYSIPTLQTELMFNEPIVLNEFFYYLVVGAILLAINSHFAILNKRCWHTSLCGKFWHFTWDFFSFLLCVKPIW